MVRLILLIVDVILAIGLIVVIVLQPGKSAGLSGSIAGGSETLFGKNKSRGVDELLSKVTGYVAAAFMLITLALAIVK